MPLTPSDIRWCERGLRNQLPLIGGWLRRRAAVKLAADGSSAAVAALTKLGFANADTQTRSIARSALSKVESAECFRAALGVFKEVRDAALGGVLMDRLSQIPGSVSDALLAEVWTLLPDDARVWSLIEAASSKKLIDELGNAWAGQRQSRMGAWLTTKQWLPARPPSLRVLAALNSGNLDVLRDSGCDVVEPLLACARDENDVIKRRAAEVMASLRNVKSIDFVCLRWWETKHDFYEWAIKKGGYVATSPVTARVGSALLSGRLEAIAKDGGEVVMPLLQAVRFTNGEVAARAEAALIALKEPGAQDMLCQQFIAREDDLLRKVVLTGKHQPRDEAARAIFFTLTGQWERYDEVDFDHSLLRATMASAPADLRQRLLAALRASGRVSLLASVTGAGDSRGSSSQLSEEETKFVIEMLREHADWSRLWRMAFDVSFIWSVRIIEYLKAAGWQPDDEDGRATCQELVELVEAGLPDQSEKLGELMPIATRRARASVIGNVNAVAFAPDRPLVAIGTGHRRLALWNYQEGRIEKTWNDFRRSIGTVAFTASGTLVAAERTVGERPCAIFIQDGNSLKRLGQLGASITGIAAIEENRFITSSRDHSVRIWDAKSGDLISVRILADWPRSLSVSPDGKWTCASDTKPRLLALPGLEPTNPRDISATVSWRSGASPGLEPTDSRDASPVPQLQPFGLPGQATTGGYEMFSTGISRETCFSPDSQSILLGKSNGDVIAFDLNKKTRAGGRRLNLDHLAPINGLVSLPKSSILVSADNSGSVKFTSWERQSLLGSVECEGFRLTSIQASPDEAFFVAGDSLSEITFWDMRGLELPALLSRPLAHATPVHMSVAQSFQSEKKLPVKARRALRFLELLLRHRFRYEIEISEVACIMGGEFEIEIEST